MARKEVKSKEVKSKEVKSKEVKHSVKSENLFICNLVAKGISLREARKRYANVAGAEESDEKSEESDEKSEDK